jgi:hypothetical protein
LLHDGGMKALAVAPLLVLVILAGCSAGDGSKVVPEINPPVAYSGFDGEHTFVIPLLASLDGEVEWSVADPSIVDLAVPSATPTTWSELGDSWVVLTTKKAGTTTLTATAGGVSATAEVNVAAYDPAVVWVGWGRYENPHTGEPPDRLACAGCHGRPDGADHSPFRVAGYTDEAILGAIVNGRYENVPGEEPQQLVAPRDHKWTLTDAEAEGIVPYLRTLPPTGFKQ